MQQLVFTLLVVVGMLCLTHASSSATFHVDSSTSPCSQSAYRISPTTFIHFCSSSIVRIIHTPTETNTVPAKFYLVVRSDWDAVNVDEQRHGDVVTLSTSELTVTGNAVTGSVTVTDTMTGDVILEETKSEFTPIQDIPLSSATYNVRQEWRSLKNQSLYGGGQYQNNFLDYSAAPLSLVQFNLEAVVPFFVSSAGWGLYWDNYSWTYLNDAGSSASEGATLLSIPLVPTPGGDPSTAQFGGTFTAPASSVYYLYVDMGAGWGGQLETLVITLNDNVVFQWLNQYNIPNSMTVRVSCHQGINSVQLVIPAQHVVTPTLYMRDSQASVMSLKSMIGDFIDYYVIVPSRSTVQSPPIHYLSTSSLSPIDEVVANYRRLTGSAPLYGKYAYGFWQCKERYHNQTEIVSAATEFRRRKIPLDAIVQDWHYWGDLGWGPQYDPSIYPNPLDMVSAIHSLDLKFMISVWSRFDASTLFYQQMASKGYIVTNSTYYDPYIDDAREMFYQFIKSTHFDIGVDAIWADATEPEDLVVINQTLRNGTISGNRLLNPYSLLTTSAITDGLRRDFGRDSAAGRQGVRVFTLTRSSFAGQQRTGAALWSGDTTGTWDMFRRQVSASLNYQASGNPYWSEDIGGFFRPDDQYVSADYHHLLIRWFQFGAFTPIFRVHGGGTNTELWHFGDDVMAVIVTSAINLRYRMLPYIYSGFAACDRSGYTMQRALVFDYATDSLARTLNDEFMFGPMLLVAPMTDASTSRSIYFPAGMFYHFYGGETVTGPVTVNATIPLNETGLFVKAGSLLPLGPLVQSSGDDSGRGALELRVYRGKDAMFELYEDDGASDTTLNENAFTRFEWMEASRTLTLSRYGNGYAFMWRCRVIAVVVVRRGHGVGVDVTPSAAADKVVTFCGDTIKVVFEEDFIF